MVQSYTVHIWLRFVHQPAYLLTLLLLSEVISLGAQRTTWVNLEKNATESKLYAVRCFLEALEDSEWLEEKRLLGYILTPEALSESSQKSSKLRQFLQDGSVQYSGQR